MENNKDRAVEIAQTRVIGNRAPTGRPNLDEMNKRNAEEKRLDRKSSYTATGIMVLLMVVVIALVYFFT